jgi:DNA-directed RNA polymerase specialized sigma24 family protein
MPPDGTDRLAAARRTIGELYDRWHSYFLRFFEGKTPHLEDAEDLAHDLFRDALIQLAKGNAPRIGEHAWLMGIARNRLADFYRHEALGTQFNVPIQHLGESDVEHVAEPEVPAGEVGEDPGVEIIRHLLQSLTPSERLAYVYRYELGLTAKQVERLGWSPSYYYRITSEMKAHVQTLLEDYR